MRRPFVASLVRLRRADVASPRRIDETF
jgi:hypothetical protein